jgi:hypothetical protein
VSRRPADGYVHYSRQVAPGDASVEGIGTIPLYATANRLLTFCPRDMDWWEYLDQIWAADETAERVSLAVLTALILCAHKEHSNSR